MNEFYHKFYSQYLQRDFELLVFGHSGKPVIIFPKAGCRYYEMKDRGVINDLACQLEAGTIKIYCPDTIDYESWYNYSIDPESRVRKHILYEQTIMKDVIDFARYELDEENVWLAGFEFGAYHSTNIALKHPDIVSGLFCLGGTYNIKKHIMGFYNEDCYFNNPPDYLPGLTDEWYLNYLKKNNIKICVGSSDSHINENLILSENLREKGINHLFEICDGFGDDFDFYKSKFASYF